MTIQLRNESDLADTFAYEVDEYNSICRTNSSQSTESRLGESKDYSSDIAFESIFADCKTRGVFMQLLEFARQSKDAVSFPYRCDTQKTCNFYRLTISISTARRVLFFNKLLGVDVRPRGLTWNRIERSSPDAFSVCSICNRIQCDAQWRYFQEMVDLDLWPTIDREMVCSSTVCAMCERGINQRIHQSQRPILASAR